MLLSDFDFPLPQELIAQTPAERRDRSRLMLLERAQDVPPKHKQFSDLPEILRAGDLLVMNDTRVLCARIHGTKPTGGKVEFLFLSQYKGDSTEGGVEVPQPGVRALHSPPAEPSQEWGECWEAMAKSSRPLREGSIISLRGGLGVRVLSGEGGQYRLQIQDRGISFLEYLDEHGEMPLPPYIDPKAGDRGEEIDHRDRYQTVYAAHPGAVAAPTAGLHFTPELLSELGELGVELAFLTLHVGLGTFLPVRVDRIEEHQMHEEIFEIPVQTVERWRRARERGGRVIAVGTTSLRALESSLDAEGQLQAGASSTSIFLRPGVEIRSIDGLLTNFHLPRSTLLMLVAALHGYPRILEAYREAVSERYRFFSYGDAMLIL